MFRNFKRTSLCLGFLGLSASGCGDSSTARSTHKIDGPFRTVGLENLVNPLDWSGSADPRADYARLVKPRLGNSQGAAVFASSEDLTTARIQSWMDRIDSLLRTRFPEVTREIPKPVANVWVSRKPNGMAMPLPTCATVKVKISNSGAADSNAMVGINFNGTAFAVNDSRCIERGEVAPELVVEWFRRNNASCTLSTDGAQVILGQDCRLTPALQRMNLSSAGRFQIIGTSPVVTLTTGMLTHVQNETQLVAVIAHELGHYYRSHPAMKTENFNYFYLDSGVSAADRPEPSRDPALVELGRKAISASRESPMGEESQSVLKEALTRHLGYYTFEQEADEIALEWLASLGISPTVMIDKMFVLLKYKSDTQASALSPDLEFGYDRCRSLYLSDWTVKGTVVSVPVGSFSNPHHSLCYRIRNVTREISAHRYQLATPTGGESAHEEISWGDVVLAAKNLELQLPEESEGNEDPE